MNRIKNQIKPVIILIVIACFIAGILFGMFLIPYISDQLEPGLSPDALYAAAVMDAMSAEANEILPLVEIAPESDMVTWNETGDKILLLTWHSYPQSYIAGETATLSWGKVWTFTDKEIESWYESNGASVEDWTLRLEQLIGLPDDAGKTHFSALWVSPEDILRPAYVTDITDDQMLTALPENMDESYVAWFDGNIIDSYYDGAYPWTRLGYTYDWEEDEREYGLSEFIIKEDSTVDVAFTYTTEEFIAWLDTFSEK